MKTKLTILLLASAFVCVLVSAQQRSPATPPLASVGPEERIISKLSEIVRIRERLAKNDEVLRAAGRAPGEDVAEIELAEARVDLARERGQQEAIVTELKGLIAAHERRLKRMTEAKDRTTGVEIDRAQAAVLAAQVRLLRAEE